MSQMSIWTKKKQDSRFFFAEILICDAAIVPSPNISMRRPTQNEGPRQAGIRCSRRALARRAQKNPVRAALFWIKLRDTSA